MADEIKADDHVTKDGKKGKEKKGKKGGVWEKYKWWIIGGVALLTVIGIWYFHSQSSTAAQNAAGQAAQNQSNIDPATGYPYGSPADLAALGSSGSIGNPAGGTPSGAGPTGPAGPAGPAGKNGGKLDLWQMAIAILKGRGIKNPTHHQISQVRQKLIGVTRTGMQHHHTHTPVHKPTPPRAKTVKGGRG